MDMLESNSSRARIARGAVLIAVALTLANCAATDGAGPEAMEMTKRTVLAEEQVQPAIRLARAARAAGDFASAANLYRSVIAVRSDDPMLTVELGDTLLDAGSFDNAIEIYGKAQSHATARLGALLGLMRAHLALGEPTKALDSADRAIAAEPAGERALAGRGVALDMLGRHEEAQISYRAALAGIAPQRRGAKRSCAVPRFNGAIFGGPGYSDADREIHHRNAPGAPESGPRLRSDGRCLARRGIKPRRSGCGRNRQKLALFRTCARADSVNSPVNGTGDSTPLH